MEKNRINYFDIAKGIGMLCVILGHLSLSAINMVVFTFHMPLFFIISGYFMKKQDTRLVIHKKFRQLLIPYFLTCLAIAGVSIVKDLLLGRTEELAHNLLLWCYAGFYGSGNPYSHPFYVKAIGAIWFLFAMFWSVVIYNGIMDRKGCSVWVLVLSLAGYFSAKYIYLPWSIQSAMLALVFIHAGHYCRIRQLPLTPPHPIWTASALLLWLFCIYVDKGRFYIVGNYSQNLVIDIAGGIAGTFLVLVLSQIIERIPLVSSGFQWFGRHSLVILCLHLVELTFLPWKTLLERIGITNIIVIGGLAVTGKLVWCITGVLIIEKIPILSVAFGLSKNTTNKEGTAL